MAFPCQSYQLEQRQILVVEFKILTSLNMSKGLVAWVMMLQNLKNTIEKK